MKTLFKFCMENNAVMFSDIIQHGDLKIQIHIKHKQLAMTEIISLDERIHTPHDLLENRLVEKFEFLLSDWCYH